MIAIIGGGISGLTLGYYLKKNGIDDFVIYEKSNFIGGKINSEIHPSYFLEKGPNTLLTTPLVEELLEELNLNKDSIYPSESQTKNRYIVKNRKISLLPGKPQELFFSQLLSIKSKLSLVKDLSFKKTEVDEYQTVSEFFKAHFSQEIVDYFVKAFCRGIYAANADELLIKSCFPALAEYQKNYGSIIKGLRANQGLEKRKVLSFTTGMQRICHRISNILGDKIQLNQEVRGVKEYDGFFELNTRSGWHTAETVIFCNEASSLTSMLKNILPETAKLLEKVTYSQLSITHSIYNKDPNLFPFKGFGVLYPPKESERLFGHIWNSNILENLDRNKTIITSMAPLSNENELSDLLDATFQHKFNLNKEELELRKFVHWKEGIPIYNAAHLDFVKKFQKENKLKLYICSNLISGVSIPDRILESKKLAQKLKNEK